MIGVQKEIVVTERESLLKLVNNDPWEQLLTVDTMLYQRFLFKKK